MQSQSVSLLQANYLWFAGGQCDGIPPTVLGIYANASDGFPYKSCNNTFRCC